MSNKKTIDIDLEDGVEEEEEAGIIHSYGPPQVKKEEHDWRQEGNHVICRACPADHGIHIGMDKMLQGVDDNGKLILISRPKPRVQVLRRRA